MIRSRVCFLRICEVSAAIPQQPLYKLTSSKPVHTGKETLRCLGKGSGGRARVLIFVTAILCEAWALAGHTFMELGERQWDPGHMGSYTCLTALQHPGACWVLRSQGGTMGVKSGLSPG